MYIYGGVAAKYAYITLDELTTKMGSMQPNYCPQALKVPQSGKKARGSI